MTEQITREFVPDLEIRADGTGRTISGIVVPFGRTARVSDGGPSYDEQFQAGAFTKTIAERGDKVKLMAQHDMRRDPLGRATLLREDAAGLYGEFRVSATRAGDDALELVRDGALDSFSVGFSPIKHVKRAGVVVRTEVGLRETSLVTFPAYEDARIQAVRNLTPDDFTELAEAVAAHLNLRASTLQEPEALGTSLEAALSSTEPHTHSSRNHRHLSLRRLAREKGVL